jgi:prolipoprotein diacylglyceryltransferase
VREPDATVFLDGLLTTGMLLSIPMVLVGLWLLVRARPEPAPLPA